MGCVEFTISLVTGSEFLMQAFSLQQARPHWCLCVALGLGGRGGFFKLGHGACLVALEVAFLLLGSKFLFLKMSKIRDSFLPKP